ncbi:PREDICTED: monocyte to macrophage differentiation factor 2 [Myotis brandtii]|uniref:monocyte to macrophage differentiation factor 2 n=1 Tax=Myotis brandtii TaxID=109478 RepID=UPI000703E80E|nr:PREDICTED: monocyte to macrophage differentiation factor 2 [Myotis brandtii]
MNDTKSPGPGCRGEAGHWGHSAWAALTSGDGQTDRPTLCAGHISVGPLFWGLGCHHQALAQPEEWPQPPRAWLLSDRRPASLWGLWPPAQARRAGRDCRFMNHRVPAHQRYQPTEYEHAANCATHALWIIPSFLGSSNLYLLSDDVWETVSAWIYGLGLCGLFVVSTVFHTVSWKKRHLSCLFVYGLLVVCALIGDEPANLGYQDATLTSWPASCLPSAPRQPSGSFRLPIAHVSLSLCVSPHVSHESPCLTTADRSAGTVSRAGQPHRALQGHAVPAGAPQTVPSGLRRLNLRELGPWAAHMRWLVWVMASVGTVYVFFFHERYKLLELLCYVVMGFFPAVVILSMPNTEGLWELVTGGAFYCLGTVFFKSDGRVPFAHAIWHLFVAFGAGTHYYAIWRYLYLPSTLQAKVSK